MNAMTQLLNLLGQVYGFRDQKKSVLRKVGQTYDEAANVHVITLEFRVRRDDGGVVQKKIKENSLFSSILG